MLDISSLSVLFFTDSLVSSSSPAISLAMQTFPTPSILDHSENRNEAEKEVIFILTIDAHVVVIDSTMGNTISSLTMEEHSTELTAISLYILGKCNNLRSMLVYGSTVIVIASYGNFCMQRATFSLKGPVRTLC